MQKFRLDLTVGPAPANERHLRAIPQDPLAGVLPDGILAQDPPIHRRIAGGFR